ncbi:hypothetical protein BHE74_00000940 [Ensete ventricosum]|nr:hypothetical protein BHE74_00000940 [Ensete ventricosum]
MAMSVSIAFCRVARPVRRADKQKSVAALAAKAHSGLSARRYTLLLVGLPDRLTHAAKQQRCAASAAPLFLLCYTASAASGLSDCRTPGRQGREQGKQTLGGKG